MVLYIGNEPIAGYSTNTKMNAHSLLDFKWSDHILNELSWVNADTFSWLSGDVYTAVYNKLVAEYDTGTTETETGVSYKKSDNGFKIADASQEQAVINAFNSTGVAWFYILDTANRRFKLPRTKYNKYMSQVAVKGNGMTLGLTNGTSNVGTYFGNNNQLFNQGSAYGTNVGTAIGGALLADNKSIGITTDASKSGMVADLSTDTNMLLYFYVGEFAQSAIEQTAGYAQTLTEKKADINLSNSTAITNCITEIPQNIKLELSDGVLTLKSGSKVYVPNGTGVFDVVTIASDRTLTVSSNDTYFLAVDGNGAITYNRVATQTASGTSTPTSSYWMYYNTNDNKIYDINDGVNVGILSFPVCKFTVSDGAISSIDQIFNGFGYIGSTVFALPNVKGLVPNGRNADGSLKNVEFTTDKVIMNIAYNNNATSYAQLNYNNGSLQIVRSGTALTSYDEVSNLIYRQDGLYPNSTALAIVTATDKITDFKPKTAFHAIDYNTPHVVSRYTTNNVIVEIWSDGFCVQSGKIGSDSAGWKDSRVNLAQTYKDASYIIMATNSRDTSKKEENYSTTCAHNIETTGFTVGFYARAGGALWWETKGYIR